MAEVDYSGAHASTHDLALKSIIEDQLRSHCKSRGLDFEQVLVELDGHQVIIKMKDGTDAREYLQLKNEQPLNRAERRANKKGKSRIY